MTAADRHKFGGSNVTAFPGIRIRRRLPQKLPKSWRKPPRPPKGRGAKQTQKRAPTYERHPQHKNKGFGELKSWQRIAYLCREDGYKYGCLNSWEMKFCRDIAAQPYAPSVKQRNKLNEIARKARRHRCWFNALRGED
nr:hypothetical protein 5 [bacterium]